MADHPWCSDVPRDTAIRAAEDAAASERPATPDHRELPERVARLEAVVFGRSPAARTDKTSQTARPCGGTDPAPSCGERGAEAGVEVGE